MWIRKRHGTFPVEILTALIIVFALSAFAIYYSIVAHRNTATEAQSVGNSWDDAIKSVNAALSTSTPPR